MFRLKIDKKLLAAFILLSSSI